MILVADECLNRKIIKLLEDGNFKVYSIAQFHVGIDDSEVLDETRKLKGILITEDSDFGKWVFSHHYNFVSIVFLRYEKKDFDIVNSSLLNVLRNIQLNQEKQFITISKNKIRYRKI